MTPDERQRLVLIIDRLNNAAEEFRASRDHVHAALLALVDANKAQSRSIDHVIQANMAALELFNQDGTSEG